MDKHRNIFGESKDCWNILNMHVQYFRGNHVFMHLFVFQLDIVTLSLNLLCYLFLRGG